MHINFKLLEKKINTYLKISIFSVFDEIFQFMVLFIHIFTIYFLKHYQKIIFESKDFNKKNEPRILFYSYFYFKKILLIEVYSIKVSHWLTVDGLCYCWLNFFFLLISVFHFISHFTYSSLCRFSWDFYWCFGNLTIVFIFYFCLHYNLVPCGYNSSINHLHMLLLFANAIENLKILWKLKLKVVIHHW